mgnify:CR=1 FL=1
MGSLGKRLGIMVMIGGNLKRDIDWHLLKGKVSFHSDEGGDYNLRGKVVVVTGGNNGIGFSSSQKFASYGATVVMGCR